MAYDDAVREDRTFGNTGPGSVFNTINTVGIVAGLLLIANRLYWRWKQGTPGSDDIIIVFAWLTLIASAIIMYVAVDYGYGRDSITLTRSEASNAIRLFYFYQIFYKITLNSSKLAILTLYLRVFDTRDWFGKITKFLLVLVSTYTFSIIVANIFICHPISTYWDTSPDADTTGKCINVLAYWYASGIYNILSECLMLLSVLVRIWTLPNRSHPPVLQLKQKINLTIVLGLGVFTIITATLRFTTLNQGAQATNKTGASFESTLWSVIEASLALAVANLPMLRQLLKWRGWCGHSWFSSSAGRSQNEHSRRRSGFTLANQANAHGSRRTPELRAEQETLSSTSIHLRRDFHREVVTAGTEGDLKEQKIKHVEFDGAGSDSSRGDSTSLKNGIGVVRSLDGAKGSIKSTRTSILRSPASSTFTVVEPLSIVRVSNEPSKTSLSGQIR